MKFIILFIFLVSCSSKHDIVQGFSGQALENAVTSIQGKTPQEAMKILGTPAINRLLNLSYKREQGKSASCL